MTYDIGLESKTNIALVYATGGIISKSKEGSMGSEKPL